MGIHDRDYIREETNRGEYFAPLVDVTWVVRLVVINACFYFADLFSSNNDHWLTRGMAVHPDSWAHVAHWWKYLAYGFAHDPDKILHVLTNMFGLWMLGRTVERVLGGWEFLRFYLLALVAGSVFWSVRLSLFGDPQVRASLIGASGAVTAVVVLFVCHFPRQQLFLFGIFPLPAWVVGIGLILADLSGAVGGNSRSSVAYDVHLAGAAFAGCYFWFRWNFGRLIKWRFNSRIHWPSMRAPRLRVHRGGDEGAGEDVETQYEAMDAEADRILAKLHERGDASLSDQERRILEDYSRRMRQKHR